MQMYVYKQVASFSVSKHCLEFSLCAISLVCKENLLKNSMVLMTVAEHEELCCGSQEGNIHFQVH